MRPHRDGFVLITALLVVSGLMTLSIVGLERSMGELNAARRSLAISQAFHLSEAGLDEALHEFAANGGAFVGNGWGTGGTCTGNCRSKTSNWPLGAQSTVTVDDITAAFPSITVLTTAAEAQQRIEATLQVTRQPVIRGAAISTNRPLPGPAAPRVDVGTAATIVGDLSVNSGKVNLIKLASGAHIKANLTSGAPGDLLVGPLEPGVSLKGNDPTVDAIVYDPTAFWDGVEGQAPQLQTFPDTVLPAGAPAWPLQTNGAQNAYNVSQNATVTLPCGQYHFGGLVLKDNATLVFDCPSTLYISKQLTLQNNARLIFRGTTPSAIYIDSTEGSDTVLELGLSSSVKTEQIANGAILRDGVQIQVTSHGAFVSLYWDSSLYGSLYAPYHQTYIRGVAGGQGNGLPKVIRGLTSLTTSLLGIWSNTTLEFGEAPQGGVGAITGVKLVCWSSVP